MKTVLLCVALHAALPALAAEVAGAAYPALLPPPHLVSRLLERQPQVTAAQAGIAVEQANSRRLAAGPYEWSVKASAQRRNEASGPRYRENEIALERPLRWKGKADKDAELGRQGLSISEARLADAWHEAARSLLRRWFEWVREAQAAQRLQQHAALLGQQADIVRRRVAAGDAPRMEMMLADTERNRAEAAWLQAAQRRDLLAAGLMVSYPGLEPALPGGLPEPVLPPGDAALWRRKILEDNHEIELADAEAALGRVSAERAALERTPDPTLGLRYAQERDHQERLFSVTVSIPIPGQARREQVLASQGRADVALENARAVRLKVEADALAAALRADGAQTLWRQLADIGRQSGSNAALVARAYELGESPLSDTLLARRQALEALSAAEQAQIDALEAQARLLLDMHAIWSLHAD
jgi:outer membrane protein TolC